MPHLGKHSEPMEQRRVIYLEFVAATAILSIIALVLFMVFSYKPG